MLAYQTINLGFSTADAEHLQWHFSNGNMQFSFVDWREQPVKFTAVDVRAFAWVEVDDTPDLRDDVTYEVLDSALIQKYCASNIITSEENYRHFKLCFNTTGVIDVVCKAIALV